MLDIIIVNWNAGDQLLACVNSVARYGADLVESTIVVDNNSTDGSLETVKDLSFVTLIHAGKNLGFGKACNLGAAKAKSEYLLFLNPDAELHPNTLSMVLRHMQAPAQVRTGICGVQLLDGVGHVSRSCARFPTAAGFTAHALGLSLIFPHLGHRMAEWDHTRNRQVDQVIGAFFLVRRGLFESLNGFDERFFVYFEEVDFSYRARKTGWASSYLADVQAFHLGGGSSNQVKAHRLFYSLRSRSLYTFKHFSKAAAIWVLLATLLLEPLSRSALTILRGSFSGLKETWAAYGMLWRWLLQWIFKGEARDAH